MILKEESIFLKRSWKDFSWPILGRACASLQPGEEYYDQEGSGMRSSFTEPPGMRRSGSSTGENAKQTLVYVHFSRIRLANSKKLTYNVSFFLTQI